MIVQWHQLAGKDKSTFINGINGSLWSGLTKKIPAVLPRNPPNRILQGVSLQRIFSPEPGGPNSRQAWLLPFVPHKPFNINDME